MNKQQGLTLIEIMIALALGIFIIAATLTVYINTIKSSSDTLKSARLSHDLGITMSLMTNDIKRAGYWGRAVIGATNLLNNPFSATATTLSIGTNITANDCILYTYDANGNGTVDANEYYGFRRYSAGNNRYTIQIRSGNAACNAASTAWESITDENMINITSVQFSFAPLGTLTATSRCLNASIPVTTTAPTNPTNALTCNPAPTAGQKIAQKRVVNIQLIGQLIGADNAEVTKTLLETVKVRNNRVYVQP